MAKEENLILNKEQIQQKIRRIAYEIYENNYQEKKLFVAGLPETGYNLAKLIVKDLKKVSPIDIELLKLTINKEKSGTEEIVLNCDVKVLKKMCIILVDDVLHTGKTFMNSLRPFADSDVKKIETVVLVKRSHKLFPISADYTGYELATTLNDHIQVSLEKDKFGVYLY